MPLLNRLPGRHRELVLDDAQPIQGWLQPDRIAEGDIMFCARPSPFQDLCSRAGEPWRHLGLVHRHEGQLAVAEVSGARFGRRTVTEMVDTYPDVAIGRLPAAGQPAAVRAAHWCCGHVGSEQVYAWDDLMLSGFIATTRRFAYPDDRSRLEAAITAAVGVIRSSGSFGHLGGPLPGYSCSAFILAAFMEAGHPIDFDLGLPRAASRRPTLWEMVRGEGRPLRSAGEHHISTSQAAVVLRALITGMVVGLALPPRVTAGGRGGADKADWFRWASPGDIWRSRSLAERWYVDRRSSVGIIDLSGGGGDPDSVGRSAVAR